MSRRPGSPKQRSDREGRVYRLDPDPETPWDPLSRSVTPIVPVPTADPGPTRRTRRRGRRRTDRTLRRPGRRLCRTHTHKVDLPTPSNSPSLPFWVSRNNTLLVTSARLCSGSPSSRSKRKGPTFRTGHREGPNYLTRGRLPSTIEKFSKDRKIT